MALDFKRNRVQLYLEKAIDPNYDPFTNDKTLVVAFQRQAKIYQLQVNDCTSISQLLKDDANDFFYNALISFHTAINSTLNRGYSWAAVNCYYTMYYLMRCYINNKEYALFRASKQMYLIKNELNETIEELKKSNTHESTFETFKRLFPRAMILSNDIEAESSIDWIKTVREIINYRARSFLEPVCYDIFQKFSTKDLLLKNIENIITNDTYVFQPEFAIFGLPLYFFKEVCALNSGNPYIFSKEKTDYLNTYINQEVNRRLPVCLQVPNS